MWYWIFLLVQIISKLKDVIFRRLWTVNLTNSMSRCILYIPVQQHCPKLRCITLTIVTIAYRLCWVFLIQIIRASGDVTQTEWHSKELGIVIIIPHKKFGSRGNISYCSVVDVITILKYHHVLFVFVTGTSYESHPAGVVFIITIEIVREFAIFVNLYGKKLLMIIVAHALIVEQWKSKDEGVTMPNFRSSIHT